MTTEQIINTLREYNAWRRDGESEMLDPKLIGKTIDAACNTLGTMQRELDEARKSLAMLHEIIRGEWPEDQAEELIKQCKQ